MHQFKSLCVVLLLGASCASSSIRPVTHAAWAAPAVEASGTLAPAPPSIGDPWQPTTIGSQDYGTLSPRPQTQPQAPPQTRPQTRPRAGRPYWAEGRSVSQGFIGVADLNEVTRKDGSESVDVGSDFDAIPVIGGGGQWKLGGDRIDYGLEGMLTLGGRANGGAIYVGSGGGAVAVSLDLFLVDFFGGPFVSVFLGEKLRLYGSVGPVMQFANYQESGPFGGSGSGFGYGWYSRAGLEFRLDHSTQIGIGARWADTEVDLSGRLGTLDVKGTTLFVSVSRGI